MQDNDHYDLRAAHLWTVSGLAFVPIHLVAAFYLWRGGVVVALA